MREINFYEVLGVERTASQDAIRLAYERKKAQAATDKTVDLKDLEWSFRALSDPARRAKFDLWLQLKSGSSVGAAGAREAPASAGPVQAVPRARSAYAETVDDILGAAGRARASAAAAAATEQPVASAPQVMSAAQATPARATPEPPRVVDAPPAAPSPAVRPRAVSAPVSTPRPAPRATAPATERRAAGARAESPQTLSTRFVNHYNVLRVARDASMSEIEEAFRRLMQVAVSDGSLDRVALQEAYEVLGNAQRRLRYNRTLAEHEVLVRRRHPERLRRLRMVYFAVLITAALIASAYSYYVTTAETRVTMRIGDKLYRRDSGELYGSVVDISRKHEFRQGRKKPAFLVRLQADQSDKWYPQDEIKRFFQTSPVVGAPRKLYEPDRMNRPEPTPEATPQLKPVDVEKPFPDLGKGSASEGPGEAPAPEDLPPAEATAPPSPETSADGTTAPP